MKLTVNLLLLVSVFTITSGFSENLNDLYVSLNQHNNLYNAAQANTEAQESISSEARAEFFPHIAAEGNYGVTHSEVSLANDATSFDNFSFDSSDTSDTYKFLVGVKQNIIDVQHWRDIDASNYLIQAKQVNSKIVQQNAVFKLLEDYFTVLDAKNKKRLYAIESRDLERAKKLANYKLAKGIGTKLNLYEAEMELEGLKAKKINNENNLQNAINNIARETSVNVRYLHDVNTSKILQLLPPESKNYWLQNLLAENLSLQKARFELLALNKAVSAQAAASYPTVYAEGGYVQEKRYLPVFKTAKITDTAAFVGVKVPLFTGGYNTAKENELQRQYEADNYKYIDAENELKNIVTQVFNDVLALHAKLIADMQAIAASNKELAAAKRANQYGLKGMQTFLDAEKFNISAKLAFKKDAYDALLLRAKLYQLHGQLDANEIARLNSILNRKAI